MKYSFESRVRFSETDETGRLSLPGLVNYFQDCATFHAQSVGMGTDELARDNLAWIVSSWQVVIPALPSLGQQVTVSTWAHAFQGFFGLRNCTMHAEDGTVCAYSGSVWVLYDFARRIPARVLPEHAARYGTEPPYPMSYAPRKLRIPAGGTREDPFQVTSCHLDRNGHVNNGKYLEFACACLPQDVRIIELRMEYRTQAHRGDMIYPRVLCQEDLLYVSLEKENGEVFAGASFAFTKKEQEKTC